MNTYIKIGQTVIKKYADYAKNKIIDDEEEYFPTLKIIISGISNASNQKKIIENELIKYAKEQYVSTWIEYAKRDEENPNIDKEINYAVAKFDKIYFGK